MVGFVTKQRETRDQRGGLCLDEDECNYFFRRAGVGAQWGGARGRPLPRRGQGSGRARSAPLRRGRGRGARPWLAAAANLLPLPAPLSQQLLYRRAGS